MIPGAARLRSQPPDPARFWIRYRPRRWPGPAGAWTDLARAALGESDPGAAVEAEARLDDLLYLPPVGPAGQAARAALAAAHLERGTPVLVQMAAGDAPPPAGACAVYDLLPALLAGGDLAPLAALPSGAAAAWPLLPGLTDEPELWRRGCEKLAAAGAAVVQAVAPALTPADRRALAEGRGDEAFDALFHRAPRPEREFARVARRFGLAPFLPRPLPRPPLGGAANKRLAGDLLLGAELWLALGRPLGQGLALSRAARWVDEAEYEVAALARDGNLAVVEALEARSRALVGEWVAAGRLRLLDELLAEYLES